MTAERFHDMNNASGADSVGGKAAMLMRLVARGFDVPAFFVVEPAAFGDLDERGLASVIAARLPGIGGGPYATRSSAREEDGASASHAGQFLSVLNLSSAEVPGAARRVFESGLESSVADYRASRGLDAAGGAPAVIVQQMVTARCAGVAFGADPVSGRRDRIVISAIAGLGDRLVGGEEDGQGFVLARADGAIIEAPDDPVLSASDLAALHELVNEVAAACGGPQDIEWAFEGDRLYLLQARPITTPLRADAIVDPALVVFDNSNIVESYPGIVSPLTFSFAQYAYSRVYRAFVELVGIKPEIVAQNAAVFDNLLARVDGRVYYNLGNWYRALALLPGFASNTASMELMMGVNQPLPAELVATMATPRGSTLRRYLGMASIGLSLGIAALRLGGTIRDFYRRLEAALAEPANSLDGKPLTALAAEYRRIEADLLDRWDAPLVNDFLCMIAFGASRNLMQRWAGAEGLALHSDIMVGQGDIVSAEPAQRIRAMGRLLEGRAELSRQLGQGNGEGLPAYPELATAVAAYLDKFADRCAEELKLESITLDRDPTPLYRAIAAAAEAPVGRPAERIDSRAQLARVFAGRPVRRFIAGIALQIAKRRVRDRENLRFERTRIFGRGRRLFRAVGAQFHALGLLDVPDDVFLLTVPEVLGAIEGFATSHDLGAIARLRKAELAAAAGRDDPGERLTLRGAVSAGRPRRGAPAQRYRLQRRHRHRRGPRYPRPAHPKPGARRSAGGASYRSRLDCPVHQRCGHRRRTRQSAVPLGDRGARARHPVRRGAQGRHGLDRGWRNDRGRRRYRPCQESVVTTAEIAQHASFDDIRYAQLWEDADVLIDALGEQRGKTLVSICSAGDNALAMLLLDPARVIAIDLSPAQIACLEIRMAAYRELDHAAFLELMGSRPSQRRGELLDRVGARLLPATQALWAARRDTVIAHGLGGVGKFERYFRLMKQYLLPLVHSQATIDAVFASRPQPQRARFLDERWNNRRWKLLLRLFFSNWVMGRLGRDPAFFEHVEGSLADHVAGRLRHAAVDLDPALNPYLHWILTGTHGAALPMAWRPENYEIIRSRLDRLELRIGALEALVESGERADGFNLSDIFEYMSPEVFSAVYGSTLAAANSGARLVYWNMMVPRRVPPAHAAKVRRLEAEIERGRAADKAFFYSDFVVEEVL